MLWTCRSQTKNETLNMAKWKALVIADVNSLGKLLSALLSTEDFDVTVVDALSRVGEIYAELSQNNYDMVLPTNNGLTPSTILSIVPEIKRKNPGAKLILLSGYRTPKFIKDLKELGVDDFFPLPFIVVDLIQRVKTALTP